MTVAARDQSTTAAATATTTPTTAAVTDQSTTATFATATATAVAITITTVRTTPVRTLISRPIPSIRTLRTSSWSRVRRGQQRPRKGVDPTTTGWS